METHLAKRRSTSPTIQMDQHLAKRRPTTALQASRSKLYPAELIRTIDAGIVEAQPILNRALKVPIGTEWQVGGDTNLIPRCVMCLVDPKHAHQDTGESFLRVNLDMTVDAVCRELGERRLRGPVARAVQAAFNVKVPIQHGTKEYEGLRDEVVAYALTLGLKRENGSGWVYQPVHGLNYALERWLSPEDYVNEVFRDDETRTLSKRGNYFDTLVGYLCKVDDRCFPFLERNMLYYGFRNGVYNIETCEFTPASDVPWDVVARKYIDQEFTGSEDTPEFDTILESQGYSSEMQAFMDACLGRLFGVRDSLQFMVYIYGQPGTGKSTILRVVEHFFEKVGQFTETFEKTFGLQQWAESEVILGDDVPANMASLLPRTILQSMIGGSTVSVAIKNRQAVTMQWRSMLMFASNYPLSYDDNASTVEGGSMARRVLVWNFPNLISRDPALLDRIVESELPAILKRSTQAYKRLLEDIQYRDDRGTLHRKDIWDVCPPELLTFRIKAKMESDPVYAFLKTQCIYENGASLTMRELEEAYELHSGEKASGKFTKASLVLADSRYEYDRKARTSATGVTGLKITMTDWSPAKAAQAATSAIAQTSECADWRVEYRTNVLGGGGDGMVDESMEWMNHATACILAGDVAEAQVKFYLCEGVDFDWRQPIRQNTEVPPHTQADVLTYFTKREGTVRAAVQLIKQLTRVEQWEAPTANFRMVTAKHGEVTGRVDFHGRTGGTMYILETKFSASDLVPGNRHCRQMEMYWRWGVSQLGVEKCVMMFYNIRTGVLEMGSFS
ncbi:hypothetical protein HDU93_006420 [Gonapodya sp. JEL0774]|nr:hypothetical protein HDU93_006420 [Gonapodya sp. JEL0774]